ncbi:uncharacterized protein MONBRDRAFT_14947 [Monosiga brevicollis MX1]|uniref:NADPH-dependent diflavin oxidoreductase 1 n=1 Tax=Monosiga brevicollis TaxID=81824 RepID=A9UT33_MONBE|nr:uncharacterized protein MONBRDRAFT_14947 [Monosiga brevicollis MX1]EDQ91424.1 predicted protein [Monosiga brevicollis MX1]|eukprot:XP_001743846.1 hypothetical protein [Monosiga brevicollis MX1]
MAETAAAGAPRRRVVVLYGSQTGTAADAAEAVGRRLERYWFETHVQPMDEYDIKNMLQERYMVFVCSTTGQGETPDNMRRTWRFLLQKRLPATALAHLQFACFGLGDSSYAKFNFVAKKLHKRLQTLGAQPFVPLGLADDQHPLAVEGALEPFVQSVLNHLLLVMPLAPGQVPVPLSRLLPPRYTITDTKPAPIWAPLTPDTVPTREQPLSTQFLWNKRVTPQSHFQDVRHVAVDISQQPGLTYRPGDVAYIMPQNRRAVVDELLAWMGVDGDVVLELQQRREDSPLPTRLRGRPRATLREILTHDLDIQAVPFRYFFELLSCFAPAEHEVERLRELLLPQGQDELLDYCHRMRRTSLEVLRDFPSTQGHLPLEYLFDLFSPLQPRAFSIASNPVVHAGRLEFCIAIVNYKTRMTVPRVGVMTSWLAALNSEEQLASTTVAVWVQAGTLRVPPPEQRLICIGPGTGVAPFRSLLLDPLRQAAAKHNVLIFGNRNREADFLFGDEWLAQAREHGLHLLLAFSRDEGKKQYVQHVMAEHEALLWESLQAGASILLAGNANQMPKAVRDAFLDTVRRKGGLDGAAAEAYVAQLEKTGRYQVETWS